jgi:transmembrane sensor
MVKDTLSEASDWLARLQRSRPDGSDSAALQAWLAESPANRIAFERVTSTWELVGSAGADFPRLQPNERHRTVGRRAVVFGTVAAGLLGTAFVLAPEAVAAQTIETGIGEQKTVTLADGTLLQLDVCSRIDIAFSASNRKAWLIAGRAYLAVAPTKVPLELLVGDCHVLSQRSRLTVARASKTAASVAVIDGDARILADAQDGAAPQSIVLTSGNRLTRQGTRTAVDRPNMIHLLSWKDGFLTFDDEKLASAAAQMNGYGRHTLTVSPDIANLRISGRFDGRDMKAFVKSLEMLLPVTASRVGDDYVVKSKPA